MSTGGSHGRALVAGLRAQGGRERARDAGRGRSRAVEGAGVGVHRRAGASSSHRPTQQEAALRRGRCRRRPGLRRRRRSSCATPGTGRSPASRCTASTFRTRCSASRCSRSTSRCPACCTHRSRSVRCSAARSPTSMRAKPQKMRGVKKIVREENFVAVIADSWWRANEALKKLKIEWDPGANGNASNETIAAMLREGLAEPNLPQARKTRRHGHGAGFGREGDRGRVPVALSQPRDDGAADLHRVVQAGRLSRSVDVHAERRGVDGRCGAKTAGLPLEKVEVHKMMLGGGFGRRGAPQDFVMQGVTIAKAMPGVPVKMMWSREEDMQHGFYRPASIVRIKAGLDAQGRLVAMHTRHRLSVDPRRFLSRRRSRGTSTSRQCARSATCPTRCRTSRSTTRCATATFRSVSGARRASRTSSTASASSTNSPRPPARTRSNIAWRCSRKATRTGSCSRPSRRPQAGARRCRRACTAASRSSTASAAMPRWWPRCR